MKANEQRRAKIFNRHIVTVAAAGWGLVLSVLCFAPSLPAQTAGAMGSSGRYLFIVDTSYSMRRRADAVQKTASNLLLSGMRGELRRGDTIGIWTINEDLYTGRLPLQRWTPENNGL